MGRGAAEDVLNLEDGSDGTSHAAPEGSDGAASDDGSGGGNSSNGDSPSDIPDEGGSFDTKSHAPSELNLQQSRGAKSVTGSVASGHGGADDSHFNG